MCIDRENIESVIYYWFDHLLVRECPKLLSLIETAIKEHDFLTFKYLQFILNNQKTDDGSPSLVYLPNYVSIYYKDEDIPLHIQLTEEVFDMITASEFECG